MKYIKILSATGKRLKEVTDDVEHQGQLLIGKVTSIDKVIYEVHPSLSSVVASEASMLWGFTLTIVYGDKE